MNRLKAVNLLEPDIQSWLLRNIKLTVGGDMTYAKLSDSGYSINLGDDFAKMSEGQQKIVILHEIAHVLRGDCLMKDSDKDPQLINVCMDSIINCNIPHFEDNFNISTVPYYWKLQESFPQLPSTFIPSWQTIYEAIEKHSSSKPFDGQPRNDAKDKTKAEAAHAKAVLEARKVESLKGMASSSLPTNRTVVRVQPSPMPPWARLLAKVKKHVRRNGFGSLTHCRTYNRPGRVEGLRGAARQPRLSVMVVLDVSGSCDHLVPVFRSLAASLKRSYNVRLGLFADRFAEIKTPSASADVGGGTQIGPVMEGLDRIRPDLAIILTDGEFFDDLVLPSCPVWFVVTGSKPRWAETLRPKDKLIMEDA